MAVTEFLKDPITIVEVTALVMSLFTLASKKAGYWSLFIFYLIITVTAETIGYYFHEIQQSNYSVYHVFNLIQIFFFSFFFYRFQKNEEVKYWLFIGIEIFILGFMIEGMFLSFTKNKTAFVSNYNLYSRMFLSVFVTFFCCNFYFSIIKDNTILRPVKYAPFWIITGLFFYYFGSLPLFAFYKFVAPIKLKSLVPPYFWTLVMGTLSVILYGSWIIGFICKKRQAR